MRMRALAASLAWVVAAGCGFLPEPVVGLGCQPPPDRPEVVPENPERRQFLGLSPQEAAALLEAEDPGVEEVTWRYSYATDADDERVSYSECWCRPPPDGRVVDAFVTEYSQLIVMVQRDQPMLGGRGQPTLGWGCEAQPGASRSAS